MNKYLLAIALPAASLSAYGVSRQDTPPPAPQTTQVFLSSPASCFEISGSALFLQPTGSHLNYAAEAQPIPVPSPNWKIHGIDTGYHVGFDVGLRGNFHCTNTNLALDWEHFHSTDSASSTVFLSTNMIGPFFEIGPDAAPYVKAHGKATFHFDEVDLDYGIFLNLGDRLLMNLYSGVSFMRIEQVLHSKFVSADGSTVRIIKVPSSFMGFGPQLGFDFTYRIVDGFHFNGAADGSLFVGTQKNHTKFEAFSPALAGLGITPPNEQKTNVHSRTQVVPGFEGKLGLSYVYNYGQHYMFKIEAGYQAQIYLNAIQSVDIGSEVITPPFLPDIVGVFARTFEQNLSNFALAGPYLTIDLGF